MEAPGQHDARSEDGIEVEVDGGGRNESKRSLEHNAGGYQEYASRQYQGLERFGAPEIHDPEDPFGERLLLTVTRIISEGSLST
jgi:hypothetical protein